MLLNFRHLHPIEPTSAVCGLNSLRPALRAGALYLNPQPSDRGRMLLLLRPLSVGRFVFLRPKNMERHIFRLESEFQNIPEAAPKASPSFSVFEKLARGFFRVIWRGDHAMKGVRS
jgi:hypothetical protein